MKTCLVSLVSDQTIPNILVTAHFKPEFLLFITTAEMERKGKTEAILKTLRLRELDYVSRHHRIEVSEDSILDLQARVTRWLDDVVEDWRYILNLTGGTKLMAIGAYDLFTDFDSTMVYVPIPRNEYLIPFPKRRPKEPTQLLDRLTVEEYLSAYGVAITNRGVLTEHKKLAESRERATVFIFSHYRQVEPLLRRLREQLPRRWRKTCRIAGKLEVQNDFQREMLSLLAFEERNGEVAKALTKSEWQYLRGGWLEERVFFALKKTLPKKADVELGVECRNQKGNENEFDVIFTLENILYLVECKSLGAPEGSQENVGGTVNDFLYKLGALRQQFGLTPTAFLATTSPDVLAEDGTLKPHLVERGEQFRITIIPLLQTPDLEGFFKSRFM